MIRGRRIVHQETSASAGQPNKRHDIQAGRQSTAQAAIACAITHTSTL
jgi:hypothetical protein